MRQHEIKMTWNAYRKWIAEGEKVRHSRKVTVLINTENDHFRSPNGFLDLSNVAQQLRDLADRIENSPGITASCDNKYTRITLHDPNGNGIGECEIIDNDQEKGGA